MPTTAPTHTFRVGDTVLFGRPNGEQTEGRVVRVNAASLTIEQTEQRGQTRIREAGAKWRVHPSLVRLVSSGNTAASAPNKRNEFLNALAVELFGPQVARRRC